MKGLLAICAALLFAGTPALGAVTRVFPEEKVAIDLPEWWQPVQPPPEHSLVAIRSPRKKQSFMLLATRLPPQEGDARQTLIDAMKENVISQGYQVIDQRPVTSHEIEWLTLAARKPDGNSMTVWTALLGQKAFMMRADHSEQSAAEDPELSAALHSFRISEYADGKLAHQPLDVKKHAMPLSVIGGLVVIAGILLVALKPAGRQRRKPSRRAREK